MVLIIIPPHNEYEKNIYFLSHFFQHHKTQEN